MRGSMRQHVLDSQRLYAKASATSTSARGVKPRVSIGVGKRQTWSIPIASIQRFVSVMSRCGEGGVLSDG